MPSTQLFDYPLFVVVFVSALMNDRQVTYIQMKIIRSVWLIALNHVSNVSADQDYCGFGLRRQIQFPNCFVPWSASTSVRSLQTLQLSFLGCTAGTMIIVLTRSWVWYQKPQNKGLTQTCQYDDNQLPEDDGSTNSWNVCVSFCLFTVHLMMLSVVRTIKRWKVGWLLNSELEGHRRKWLWPDLKYYFAILMQGVRKTTSGGWSAPPDHSFQCCTEYWHIKPVLYSSHTWEAKFPSEGSSLLGCNTMQFKESPAFRGICHFHLQGQRQAKQDTSRIRLLFDSECCQVLAWLHSATSGNLHSSQSVPREPRIRGQLLFMLLPAN
jgi:hypothetical protein